MYLKEGILTASNNKTENKYPNVFIEAAGQQHGPQYPH